MTLLFIVRIMLKSTVFQLLCEVHSHTGLSSLTSSYRTLCRAIGKLSAHSIVTSCCIIPSASGSHCSTLYPYDFDCFIYLMYIESYNISLFMADLLHLVYNVFKPQPHCSICLHFLPFQGLILCLCCIHYILFIHFLMDGHVS